MPKSTVWCKHVYDMYMHRCQEHVYRLMHRPSVYEPGICPEPSPSSGVSCSSPFLFDVVLVVVTGRPLAPWFVFLFLGQVFLSLELSPS